VENPLRRRGLESDLAVNRGPKVLRELPAVDLGADQGLPEGLRAGEGAGAAVSLVFIGPRQYERIGIEVGRIPLEELHQQARAGLGLGGQRFKNAVPGLADPVNPAGEPAVVAGEVGELMRQDRLELCGRQPFQQRQAEAQVILVPAQRPQSRYLHHRGIELPVQEHLVKPGGVQAARQLAQLGEQGRRVWRVDGQALGRIEPDPQRAQDDPAEAEGDGQQDHRQFDRQVIGVPDHHHHDGDGAQSQQDHYQAQVEIACRGQQAYPPQI
jgi:hypothetical protein